MTDFTVIRRPRVGDRLLTGRHGVVTVIRVHSPGLILQVQTADGYRTQIERVLGGSWCRLPAEQP